MTIRVVVYGVGPIGQLIARVAFNRGGFDVVGAIDIDPQKVGKDLGEVIGLVKPWVLGLRVTPIRCSWIRSQTWFFTQQAVSLIGSTHR